MLVSIENPSNMIMLADSDGNSNWDSLIEHTEFRPVGNRHEARANSLFIEMHVVNIKRIDTFDHENKPTFFDR